MGKKSSHKKQQKKVQSVSVPATAAQPAAQGRQLGSLSGTAAVSAPAAQPLKKGALAAIDTTEFIRDDIRRIGLFLLAAVVILGVLVAVNTKTAALKQAGKSISTFMKLQ